MVASMYGHLELVRTLLEAKADINAKTNVRNQLMMIMILILLTIFMMMIVVINDEDRVFMIFIIFYFIFISYLFIIIIGWIHSSHEGQSKGSPQSSTYSTRG